MHGSQPVTQVGQLPTPVATDPALRSLIVGLADLGAVKFGDFTLASGTQSPIYIDLRLLVSQPKLLAQAAEFYAKILADLAFDRIAGVPYARCQLALPWPLPPMCR